MGRANESAIRCYGYDAPQRIASSTVIILQNKIAYDILISMKLIKGLGEFFGLDIGTNAVRVVQLGRANNGWSLLHYGYAPVDSTIIASDAPVKLS